MGATCLNFSLPVYQFFKLCVMPRENGIVLFLFNTVLLGPV